MKDTKPCKPIGKPYILAAKDEKTGKLYPTGRKVTYEQARRFRLVLVFPRHPLNPVEP